MGDMYKNINKLVVAFGIAILLASFSFVAKAQNQPELTSLSSNLTASPVSNSGGLSLVSMLVVLAVLALMSIVYIIIGSVINGSYFKRESKPENCGECGEVTGDVSAAIAFAINQYAKDLHADENNIITIRKVARTYSPWSSKIYQIRQSPR